MNDDAFSTTPVSHAIFRLARAHKALAGRLLRRHGLHPGQELILMTLWDRGPQRQVDMVEAVESDAPTMARSVARLERAGLVRRTPSPTDRRSMIVEAAEKSLEIKQAVEASWRELEEATVGTLSPARLNEIVEALAELEKNVDDFSAPPAG